MSAWTPPHESQLAKLQSLVARPENRVYFFDRLENPEWVAPLAERGFFAAPPGPVHDREKGTIRFPPWHEGRYLVRMAPKAPDAVFAVLEALPRSDSPTVTQTALEIMGALPDAHFGRLAAKAVEWLRGSLRPYWGGHFADEAAETVSRLARLGETDTSLSVVKALLRLEAPSEAMASDESDDGAFVPPPVPVSQLSDWEYGNAIEQFLPDVVDAAGLDAVRVFSGLLNDALRLSSRDGESSYEADHSYIWRSAIEEHAQNSDREFRGVLVAAVRDSAVRLASTSAHALEAVMTQLEKGTTLHRRIALHVLAHAHEGVPMVTERIADRGLFDDHRLRHEYAGLLRRRFGDASDNARRTFFDWVAAGPDLDNFRQSRIAYDGSVPDEDDEAAYVACWQRDWLGYVADHLPDREAALYRRHVEYYGASEHPDFLHWTSVTSGPNSPVSKEELDAWPPARVVEYLSAWRPDADNWRLDESMDGLGRVVKEVVTERAAEFVAIADSLATLDPTYVRSCLDGFEAAIKDGIRLDWDPVVRLMASAVAHPFEAEDDEHDWDRDPGWRWTRSQVASLIQTGTADRDNRIPFALREPVWQILATLVDDPHPSPSEEATSIESMGPHGLSLNTNRSTAMRSVMSYALWCRRELPAEGDDETGFDAMPEVSTVLEAHLDPARDPSLAVRSVYGSQLPWLALIDEEWATAHLGLIFPAAPEHAELRDAAWNTYICWCQPYDPMFGLLRAEYEAAIGRVPSGGSRDLSNSHEADQDLSEHLITFYWRGILPMPMLERWFEKAGDELAAHSMDFLGRALRNTTGDIQSEVLRRIRELWDWRLRVITTETGQHPREASAYAATFVSSKLDEDWSLAALESVVDEGGPGRLGRDTIEHLTQTAAAKPATATRLTLRILEGAANNWDHSAWRHQVRDLLNATADAPDDETREHRSEIIDHYVTRGHYDFKNHIRKPT